ncbi:MAG: DUF1015 domain-containing protein [Gammaproteobacteria bacterium]|nr:DUF1015 domain-containing protein [Gammaproteobacteria bacterium]
MSLIRPLQGLRPKPEFAAAVIAPPYDVLNSEEARLRAQGRPLSFLHISKPEIDLPALTDPYDPAVYTKGAENFQKLIDQRVLVQDSQPCYYLYRLIMGAHQQTGVVAVASVADYNSNRIRKHEYTRPDKEDDRVRQIDALNAQTGPVFLTYRQHPEVDRIVNQVTATTPQYDLSADDGVRHSFWVIDNAAQIETITRTFDSMRCLYIADGHHRSAAAARVAALRRSDGGDPVTTVHEYFLAVIFPDNQMQILDYNRLIRDLNGLSIEQFKQQLSPAFEVAAQPRIYKPQQPGEFSMYLAGQWYRLRIKPGLIPLTDPVRRLDVSLLQDNLIAPILGITDPRRDKRIDFVGGIRGLAELVRRVDGGEMRVAFALYPTQLSDLMAVADANQVMPPKSTWFEPKLADGLVSYLLK